MYRLTVVAGPTRGNSYPLHEGETTIGRHSENQLVLNSGKVSKKHCVLVVSNGEVVVKDQGSSNGTFVNGVLARVPRQITPGDKVSVGEFVLELSKLGTGQGKKAVALSSRVGGMGTLPPAIRGIPIPGVSGESVEFQSALKAPTDFKGRLLWIFERRVMPYFYAMLTRHEWRTMVFASFAAFALLGVVLTVSPLLENNDRVLLKELERRATAMARVIVESNIQAIQQQAEAKTGVLKSVDGARGVRQAVLVDLDSRIIAPAERYNQYLSDGPAAVVARRAKRLFVEEGRSAAVVSSVDARNVVAVEPMILFSPREGRNIPVAMAVVSIDAGSALAGFGEESVAYMEALIIMGVVGGIIALLLYRLTLRPLQVLHEEMDRSLKGERLVLSRDLKFEELRQLQDLVETALQRVASQSSSQSSGMGLDASPDDAGRLGDDMVASYRVLGDACPHPVAICDGQRRALYLNSPFEDVTGIRFDPMENRPLQELARDQAFGVMLDDLFQRCSSGGSAGVGSVGQEIFEFSGVNFTVKMVAVPGTGLQPRGFVFMAQRMEGG